MPDDLEGAVPFTLSHPAAVIPLARSPLVPSALVIGSMAPDVPYFFFMMELRAVTHRPLGLVTVDLAIGLALYAVFHLLWRRPLTVLAPDWARARLPAAGPARWPWVVPSLLAGTLTHVFWDAFTHRNHSFAGRLPWLVTHSFAGLELYRWLQYGSGVLGLVIIAWWLARWVRTAPAGASALPAPPVRTRLAICAALGALSAVGGLLSALTLAGQPDLPRTVHMTLASGVIGTITTATLVLTVYALWWHTGSLRTNPPSQTAAALAERRPGHQEDHGFGPTD